MQAKRFWLARAVCPALMCLSLVSSALAMPYESEAWDCPTAQEHYWCYWDETYDPYPPPDQHNYHNSPMNWQATGGVRDSGYVWTPLASLWSEHDVRAYWPAYITEQVTGKHGVPHRDIDLTIEDAHIQAAMKDDGGAGSQVNLHGAKVYFFVGHYWVDPVDPSDDQWAFFYNANGHFSFEAGRWTTSTIPVGEGTTDWGIISMSGMGNGYPVPPVSQASELFDAPQQWGFVIFDPAASVLPAPSGTLAFDNWAVVPEPATLGLLALGGLALMRRHRTA